MFRLRRGILEKSEARAKRRAALLVEAATGDSDASRLNSQREAKPFAAGIGRRQCSRRRARSVIARRR